MAGERQITLSTYPWQARGFGLLFALFGLLGVVFVLASGSPPPPPPPPPSALPGLTPEEITELTSQAAPGSMAWIPGIFVAVGLGIALVRYRVVLDVDRRVRVTTSGWGPLLGRTEIALEGLTSIEVAPAEQRGTGNGSFTAFPVRALGAAGSTELLSARSVAQARTAAQAIAEALHLPLGPGLGDGASAGQALDAAAAADALAALQLPPAAAMAAPTPEELQPPAGTAVAIEELARGIAIRYPTMGRGPAGRVLGALLPLALLVGFWWCIWRPALMPRHHDGAAPSPLLLDAPLALAALGLLIALVAALRSGTLGGTIRVDSQEGLRGGGHRASPERVLAIEVLPSSQQGGGLRIVLESSSFVLARGQREMDLRWMRALILQHLRT